MADDLSDGVEQQEAQPLGPGGERAEDLDQFRQDEAICWLPQTPRLEYSFGIVTLISYCAFDALVDI
jgi:hypothetical protein